MNGHPWQRYYIRLCSDCSCDSQLPLRCRGACVLPFVQSKGCDRVLAAVVPRFIPTCSQQLLEGLGALAQEQGGLHIHTHISESRSERLKAGGPCLVVILHCFGTVDDLCSPLCTCWHCLGASWPLSSRSVLSGLALMTVRFPVAGCCCVCHGLMQLLLLTARTTRH